MTFWGVECAVYEYVLLVDLYAYEDCLGGGNTCEISLRTTKLQLRLYFCHFSKVQTDPMILLRHR